MTIEKVEVKCFKIPTETPERDGTLEWESTGLVTVELTDGDQKGLGYTYADKATAEFITEHALPLLQGAESRTNAGIFDEIKRKNRNMGNAGVAAMALSAVDVALWDLKAHLMNVSIQDLCGWRREGLSLYGSGLFINNTAEELAHQIERFSELGMKKFKMKIGRGVRKDLERVNLVRGLLPEDAELYVDANGFYHPKEALELAFELEKLGVTWFEEPISSDDVAGLSFLKKEFPSKVNLVSGEYCYQDIDVLRLLKEQAVDIIMVDATRCEGVTGIYRAANLAHAFNVPLSTHCAPLLHGNLAPCLESLRDGECFYDHLRIEDKYFEFDGHYEGGSFIPAPNQKGFGWALRPECQEYLVYEHTTS